MLDRLRRWRTGFFSAAPRIIPDELWGVTLDTCRVLQKLDAAQRERLRELTGLFLARKRFSPIADLRLDDARCLIIAAQACLPVLHLGFDWLRGWREVIVYPGAFRVRREHHDEQSGVVTEGDDVLIGEAWERGPLVLSWADIEADLTDPHAGFNVIIHEVAHKLDMLTGASDGVPPLPRSIVRAEWIATFQQAYADHCAAVDAGRITAIDEYAAESADEFFACLCETWYSDPATVCRAMPSIAALLQRLFVPEAPHPG